MCHFACLFKCTLSTARAENVTTAAESSSVIHISSTWIRLLTAAQHAESLAGSLNTKFVGIQQFPFFVFSTK